MENVGDGWHTPEDRRLMVRAVARMSDQCDAPELTPECPFYQVTSDGTPACAEQCQDLIARYPEDHSRNGLILGDNIHASRRRSRRGPDPDSAAYDARQLSLEDARRPIVDWHFGSLLVAARELCFDPLNTFDPTTTDTNAADVIAELTRRGIYPDVVLPLGLARYRTSAIAVAFFLKDSQVGAQLTERLGEWAEVLSEFGEPPLVDDDRLHISARASQAITGWLYSSTASTVLSDTVPTAADLVAGVDVEADPELVADAGWLIERFTETYLDDWSPASLSREWRYIRAQRTACCPSGLMRQRVVDPTALSATLADAHCDDEESNPEAASREWTMGHFKTNAVNRLADGRTTDAAAIFRVLQDLQPDEPDLENDLGFCLLPTDPKEAFIHLENALDRGSSTPKLTKLNLAIASHRVGNHADAARYVASSMDNGVSDNESFCFVWMFGEQGRLQFTGITDLPRYGEYVAEHLDSCGGSCVPPASTRIQFS